MSNNNGGPAFPTGTYEYDGTGNVLPYQDCGMSLRDYFAAKAMVGWLSTWEFDESVHGASLAEFCYRIADAMLAERER